MYHRNATFWKERKRLIKLQMIQPVKYHVLFFFNQIFSYKRVSN